MIDFLKKTTISNFTVGIVASIVAMVPPTLLIIEVTQSLGFSHQSTVNWLFGFLFVAGCIGLFLAWTTKLPINMASNVPAIVFLSFSLQYFSLETAAFGYACAGILLALIGWFKLYDKVMGLIKAEIVFAMFAGALLQYALNLVTVTVNYIFYGLVAIITFLVAMRYVKLVPPVLISMIVITLMLSLEGAISYSQLIESTWVLPQAFMISPSWSAFIGLSIPMVFIILSGELTVGISILRSEGYQPPTNKMTFWSGIGTVIGSFFGNPCVNTSGVPIGIVSSSTNGPMHLRYVSAIWSCLFVALFGVLAHYIVLFFSIYPLEILSLLVGLALTPILIKALYQAFGTGASQYGAFTSFIVSVSGISLFHIGAPFWAIIFGLIVSMLADYRKSKN